MEEWFPIDDRALPKAPGALRIGSTCWRIERAERVSFVVDAAVYFAAAKAAMRRARRSILLLGWDFDPRTRLEPDKPNGPRPDEPDEIGALLKSLVAQRRDLLVHVLIWDMPWIFAVSRPVPPQRAAGWLAADHLYYRLDGALPVGACHHQKVLVVDDAIAFCGGMDFAINRWDTPAHLDHDPYRRLPNGGDVPPRHDLMMAVDGAAAAALGDLVRERWHRATGKRLTPPSVVNDVWPDELDVGATSVPVGIVRTEPAWRGWDAVRENETLYLHAITGARHWIYLESQYFASPTIADALAARLAEPNGPEIVLICSERSLGSFDRFALDPARDLLVERFRTGAGHERFRLYAPQSMAGTPIIVHSKVMIVDHRLVRIGSANLNNRSMGLDTECDLVMEAVPGRPEAERVGRAARRLLCRLLGEHLGSSADAVDAMLVRTGGLIATVEALNRPTGRRLNPIAASRPRALRAAIGATHLLDPKGTIDLWRPWKRRRPRPKRR